MVAAAAVTARLSVLFFEGEEANVGEVPVAAVQHKMPAFSRAGSLTLPRAKQALEPRQRLLAWCAR